MNKDNYSSKYIDNDYFTRPTYDDGSAVRKAAPQRDNGKKKNHIKAYVPETDVEAAHKPRVGRGIDFFSMILLSGAIVACVYFCFNYLQTRADIIQLEKSVNRLESTLKNAERDNEAFKLSLEAEAPDLNYVFETAVGKLGMVFPDNNEVIYYNVNEGGYFRQYGDIPTK